LRRGIAQELEPPLDFFSRFAARFSINDLPGFFVCAFCGDF
jgi:hypothetical protein